MLSNPYVDTDILIRLLTGDDPKKQEAAAVLFEKVEKEEIILLAPDTAIADAVFVLSSSKHYNLPRGEIRDLLMSLLRYPNFKVKNKQILIKALNLYAEVNIDFGDAILAVLTQKSKEKTIYSYDHDFDKIPGIKRKEP